MEELRRSQLLTLENKLPCYDALEDVVNNYKARFSGGSYRLVSLTGLLCIISTFQTPADS